MRSNILAGILALTCALAAWSCSGVALPSSPSALTPLTAPGAGGARLRALDDPPAPDPPPPAPIPLVISIVGSFGFNAFAPNPIQANVGDMIVWTNNDTALHHIVLDEGADLGDVAPGQSSAPMALTTPAANFHCTIHPTMVGSINGAMPPPPVYYPPPPDDYGYY